jgi:anion-transporting  ArsA/GET3 family ATPase
MANRRTFDPDALPLGLQPRTVFVTGKGGVGKSTVAASLALAWRDAGARTLLVEIEGQASASAMLSSKQVGYEPVPLGEHLAAMRITLLDALREYARMRLKLKLVADRLVDNPVIDQFAQAAPGFRELLVLGKLWSMSKETDERGHPKWDAIVVDSPATGHGLGLLGMAGVIARMFPVGPISGEAKAVDAFVRDPARVGVVLVALPEELPVTETLELRAELAERGVDVAAHVLNGLLVDRFSDADAETVAAAASTANLDGDLRHALETVEWEHVRCVDQAAERARLEAGLNEPVCVLPYMFAPQLEREHVASLARWLGPRGQEVLLAQLAGAADGPAAAAAVHAAATTEAGDR